MRVTYNSPLVLSFCLAATGLLVVDRVVGGALTAQLLSVPAQYDVRNVAHTLRLFLFPLGHADFGHLSVNLAVILLVGPLLEEKHKAGRLALLAVLTTLVTALLHVLLFRGFGLLGASGIAFMLIILASFTNVRKGTIPLTFVLAALLFLGHELAAPRPANVSTLAHLVGGLAGGLYGLRGSLR